jgi:hypothetical protein
VQIGCQKALSAGWDIVFSRRWGVRDGWRRRHHP